MSIESDLTFLLKEVKKLETRVQVLETLVGTVKVKIEHQNKTKLNTLPTPQAESWF